MSQSTLVTLAFSKAIWGQLSRQEDEGCRGTTGFGDGVKGSPSAFLTLPAVVRSTAADSGLLHPEVCPA